LRSLRSKEDDASVFRVIFHLDMDAFYASVEQRDHPALRGKPVIVGSPPTQRGVVCAASYEARKFGVRSAMPSVTAGRLCPKGVFVRPRMDAYREESRAIMEIVRASGALIEQVSVDEAYLDFSAEHQRATADASLLAALPLARELRRNIFAQRQLTASIGVAANKFLAKLASDFQKPNGLTLVPERDKVLFLRSMPVRAIHGVGQVTEQVLKSASINTIGDLQDYAGDLRALVGSWASGLKRLAFGEDERPLDLGDERKSISSENTFLRDTADRRVLRDCLREQTNDVAATLRRKRLEAQTVQVKVRYSDFTTLTRQISVEEPISDANEIYRLAAHLLAREKLVSRPLRLLGVGVSGLMPPAAKQLSLPLQH
jgi:DNA polymerase-4